MNVNRLLLIGFTCLALYSHLYAQSQDMPGYYINVKGDTVFGKFINYREPSSSPFILSFQGNASSSPTELSPGQCKKVSIDQSDSYVSYQGKRLTNSTDYQSVQTGADDMFEDISAFLRVLYDNGHYHLYEFVDKKRSNFYVSDGDGPLQELSYKEFMNNGNVVEWPGFRLQLQDLFQTVLQKNPERQGLIDHVHYNSSNLTDLFSKMATGKKAAHIKGKYPARFFVGLGASANSLSVTQGSGFDASTTDNVSGTYPSQTTPLYEAGIKLFSQRNDGRFFVTIRANYYNFKHAADSYDMVSNSHTETTFKSNALSLPLGIGYSLIKKRNFSFDLSAGFQLLLLLQNSEIQVTNSALLPPSTNISPNPKSEAFSFFGEAAIVLYNRLSVFGGYYPPATITDSQDYNVAHTSFRFGARCYIF